MTNIVNEVSLELEEKHITVVNSLKKEIQIRGNYSLLYSIFRNLMDNAIAYAETISKSTSTVSAKTRSSTTSALPTQASECRPNT